MRKPLLLAAALVVLIGCSHDHDRDMKKNHSLQVSDLPAAVQKTIAQESDGGTVTGIIRHHHHGKHYYDVYVTEHGRYWNISIESNGKLIEKKHEHHPHVQEREDSTGQ